MDLRVSDQQVPPVHSTRPILFSHDGVAYLETRRRRPLPYEKAVKVVGFNLQLFQTPSKYPTDLPEYPSYPLQ